jgi:iron complex outermembrane receptor protein
MTKKLLLLTCASSALGMWAGVGHAATAAATATDQGATSVTELVVMAEKHEVSLQKVPVAVSVFTGAQRDTLGINTVADVTNFAPGFTYDPGNVHAFIRGLGRTSVNITNEQRVANYEDEFFVYSPYGLDKSSLFLSQEQIERGPQNVGGRNASGGSIDMISVRPTDTPYAEVRATIGNFGTYNLEAAASGQIAPGLDVRIAGFDKNQNQGYYTNLTGGPSEGDVVHEWYVEAQADWKPNDKFEFWARGFAEGWNGRGDAGSRLGFQNGSWNETTFSDASALIGGSLYGNPNFGYSAPNGNPTAFAAVQSYNAGLIAANNALPILPTGVTGTPGVAYQNPCNLCLGQPLVTSVSLLAPGILNNPSSFKNPNIFAASVPRRVQLANYDDFNYIMTYHFDGFDFKYTGGVQGYDYYLNDPGDGEGENTDVRSFTLATASPAISPLVINPLFQANYVEDDYWTDHDFTLQSTTDGPLQWTGGLFYYFQHYNQPYQVTAAEQPQFAAPLCLPALVGSALSCGTASSPAAAAAGAAAPNPNLQVAYFQYQFNVQTISPYGQVSYKFNDQLKLTGSLRWTQDQKNGTENTRYISLQALLSSPTAAAAGACGTGGIAGTGAASGACLPLYMLAGAATPTADVTQAVICSTGTGTTNLTPGVAPSAGNTSCLSGPLAYGVRSAAVIEANGDAHRALGTTTSAFTGGADLEWTPTPDIFTYLRYGRGYTSPSFNAGQVIANPASKPEYLNAYEIGYKENFGRNLLIDLAAFYYDYDEVQTPLSISNGGVVSSLFINVPKAVSEGVEAEVYWTPVKDLSFTLSYSYDHTAVQTACTGTVTSGVLTPAPNALCLIDTNDPGAIEPGAQPFPGQTTATRDQSVKGNPLPNAPENKIAMDLAYTFHFDPGDLILSGTYAWRDTQSGSLFNRFYNVAPSWDDVSIRALWKGPKDKYEIIAYVKNVFNTLQYTVGAAGAGLAGSATAVGLIEDTGYELNPPRTFGVEVRYKFF